MAGRKSDFTLTRLDDLFTTQAQREEERLSKIRDIPLELIDDFPDHPFKVRDDEDMQQLVESIKERGVITPATVRQKEDGRYELVSGHRRKRASELAGFETLRCEVVDLNRDEATILMVESNFQRSQILPSEKAFAYKMRLEAMKRQAGRPTKNNLVPVGQNYSREELAAQSGESQTQIQRYIRLTNLVPELLEFVDEGRIKMRPAVELSYLDEDCQRDVVDEIDLNDATPSHDHNKPSIAGGNSLPIITVSKPGRKPEKQYNSRRTTQWKNSSRTNGQACVMSLSGRGRAGGQTHRHLGAATPAVYPQRCYGDCFKRFDLRITRYR